MSDMNDAKNAIETLQSKWWRGNGWNGVNAWQRNVIGDAIVTYTLLSEDYTYVDVSSAAISASSGLSGNDDWLWWGIAALKQFYVTGDAMWWDDYIIPVYNKIVTYWDDTCGGGIWWDTGRTYKNAITNELWLTFVMLMYAASRETEYLNWGNKAWSWFKSSGMINSENLVNDGLTSSCQNNGETTWTYNQGVFLSALANLYLFGSQDINLEAQGYATAQAVSSSLTTNGILKEIPTALNLDQESFKGIYMQNLGYFLSVFRSSSSYTDLQAFMNANASQVENNATVDGEINAYWTDSSSKFDAAAQGSGIQLYNGTYAASATPSQDWSYVRTISGVGTSATPSSATFNGLLYSAWTGVENDDSIYYATMNADNTWSGQNKIPNVGTSLAPALAAFDGRLYAAWKGVNSDDGIYYASMDTSGNWSAATKIPGEGTSAAPALAACNGRLYLAWKGVGTDDSIYHWFYNGSTWSNEGHIPNVGTTSGVSLAAFGNDLYACWKGVNSDDGVYFAILPTSSSTWSSQRKIPDASTDGTPSLTEFSGAVCVAWKNAGARESFYYSYLLDNGTECTVKTPYLLPGVAAREPALATFNGRLYNVFAGAHQDNTSICFSCCPSLTSRGF